MKKFKLAVPIFILMLVLVGCGKTTPKEEVIKENKVVKDVVVSSKKEEPKVEKDKDIKQKTTIKKEIKKNKSNAVLKLKLIPKVEIKDGKCKIVVETNLPNDTELIIGLSSRRIVSEQLGLPEKAEECTAEQLVELVELSYDNSITAKVIDGIAESEWFAKEDSSLDKSKYELSVSMSIVRLQPESVQKVLGVKGKNLVGKYVEKNKAFDDKWINYEKIIEIK